MSVIGPGVLTAHVTYATIADVSAAVERLPPRRSGVRLWSMRLLGVIATGALLAVGATIVMTVAPDRADEAAVTPSAPADTKPATKKKTKKQPARPKLTKAQRAQRAAAVDMLSQQGYRPVALADYRPGATLRVLIGRGDGGQRAFFFAGTQYIGNDAADDSDSIRVARAGNRSVALRYKTGRKTSTRVLFRWDGRKLAPQTAIPPSAERHAR
jgi:hypothetical protein